MFVFLWIFAVLFNLVSSNCIWNGEAPGKRSPDVVYQIGDLSASNVTAQSIKEGLAFVQENTCVNFFDSADAPGKTVDLLIRNAPASDPASFPDGPNGHCEIAIIDGQSNFLLGNCISARSVMVHELGHYLGMCHTQNRNDWRDFIVPLDSSTNFDTSEGGSVPVPAFKYDYGSIMHSTNIASGAKSLQEDFSSTFGQSLRVSFTDYRTINWLFNCDGNCGTKPDCKNGGYTHPRDCNKCMCNKYYTGVLCETPRKLTKLSCEGNRDYSWSLNAGADASLPTPKVKDDYLERNENLWNLIEAPANTHINVEVNSIAGKFTTNSNCAWSGLEINDGDLNMVGRMFCDNPTKSRPAHSFTAKSNLVGFHVEYLRNTWVQMSAKFTLVGCD